MWAAAVTVMVVAMMVQIMRPGNALGAQGYDGTDSDRTGEVHEQGSLHVRTEFEDIKDMLRQRCIAVLENGVKVEDMAVLSDVFGDRQIKLLYDALAAELENQGQTVPDGLYAVIRDSSVPAKWRIMLDSADVERIAGIMMEYIENNRERLYDGDRLSDANVSALVREALESAMSGQEGRFIVSKEYISGSSDIIREVISNITGNGSYRIQLSDEDVRRITDELKDQIQMPPSQKQILGHEELNVLLNGWQEQITRSIGSMIDFCNSKLDELGSDIDYMGRRVDNDMASLEGKIDGDMSSLGGRLSDDISSARDGLDALSQRQDASDIRLDVIRQDNEENIAALKDSTMQLIEELSAVSDSHGTMLLQNAQAVENLRNVCEALEMISFQERNLTDLVFQ